MVCLFFMRLRQSRWSRLACLRLVVVARVLQVLKVSAAASPRPATAVGDHALDETQTTAAAAIGISTMKDTPFGGHVADADIAAVGLDHLPGNE
jgi:hypothetical protein